MKRSALDGAERRRLDLFRHGAVDYVHPDGSWVEDPDVVRLNPRGRDLPNLNHSRSRIPLQLDGHRLFGRNLELLSLRGVPQISHQNPKFFTVRV